MNGIFISYRRQDAPGHAGRLYDRLKEKFGQDSVVRVWATAGTVIATFEPPGKPGEKEEEKN